MIHEQWPETRREQVYRFMLCLLGAGFLTGQQINGINVFFSRKVRRFGLCSSTCACDVSEYLSLADSKLFKSIQSPSHGPTACLTHFHLRRTSVVCVLEDMVTPFPYVSIVFAKTLLFPGMARCLFYFCHCYLQCMIRFLVFCLFAFFNICVSHLLFY